MLLLVVAGIAAVLLVLPLLPARGKIAFGLQSYAHGSAVFMITNVGDARVNEHVG